jgi:hypothetical protein
MKIHFIFDIIYLKGLIPIPVFDEFFLILAETPLKKVRKYGVLTNFFQKVVGKIRKNWKKLGIGISPLKSKSFILLSYILHN